MCRHERQGVYGTDCRIQVRVGVRRLGHDRYARLRIGIDAPGETPQADYVLGTFRPQQRESVDRALTEATEAAACWAARGCTEAMNRFNRRQTASP